MRKYIWFIIVPLIAMGSWVYVFAADTPVIGAGGGVTAHNDATGIQGGQTGEYNHLNNSHYQNMTGIANIHKHFDGTIQDLGTKSTAFKVYWNQGNYVKVILGANVQMSYSGLTPNRAATVTLQAKQDGTGSRILSYGGNNIHLPGGTVPVLSTGANDVDVLEWKWNGSVFHLTNAIFDSYSAP